MTSHRMHQSREYRAWARMKQSCINPKVDTYKKYGGAGISVCPEWMNDFSRFIDDMGLMPEECNGIMLLDETKDFCKWNCRWTMKKKGAYPKEDNFKNSKPAQGKVQQPKTICLTLEKDLLDFIRKQALQKSLEAGHYIEPNDLIRQVLAQAFPAPKQFDMFGAKK